MHQSMLRRSVGWQGQMKGPEASAELAAFIAWRSTVEYIEGQGMFRLEIGQDGTPQRIVIVPPAETIGRG